MNMKKNLLIVLMFGISCNPLYAVVKRSEPTAFTRALAQIISFPADVSHTIAILPNAEGFIQLDEIRINAVREKFEQNFKMRHYLSYGSFAINGALLALGLHQLGVLNLVWPVKEVVPLAPSKTVSPAEFVSKTVFDYHLKEVNQKIGELQKKLELQQKTTRLGWIWNGTKSLGSYAVIGLFLLKAQQIKNYIEAQPSFARFDRHGLTDRVIILRETIKALTDLSTPFVEDGIAYHKDAIRPMVESIVRNLEELIAFMDYYFATLDQEMVHKQSMDTIARYLFNTGNDFLMKINSALQNNEYTPEMVAYTDELKNELIMIYNRCILFEKEFVAQG